MRTFVVCGSLTVADVEPGGTVTEEQLGEANIEALIHGGHIMLRVTSKKAAEAVEPDQEQ